MSGFFMLPRPLFETLAANLTGQGFKILLDLALSSPAPLRVIEVPCLFHERTAGESKLDALVLVQFAGLLIDKVLKRLVDESRVAHKAERPHDQPGMDDPK